jgi:hypothetical protein
LKVISVGELPACGIVVIIYFVLLLMILSDCIESLINLLSIIDIVSLKKFITYTKLFFESTVIEIGPSPKLFRPIGIVPLISFCVFPSIIDKVSSC